MIPGIGTLFTTLASKISLGLNIVLISVFVLMLVSKNADIKNLETDLAKTEKERDDANKTLGICRANNATYRTAVETQNRSIEAMATTAEANARLGTSELNRVRVETKPMEIKVSQIGAAKPQSSDLCAEADKLILESVK
jgi:hypothetical protein